MDQHDSADGISVRRINRIREEDLFQTVRPAPELLGLTPVQQALIFSAIWTFDSP